MSKVVYTFKTDKKDRRQEGEKVRPRGQWI